MTELCTCGHPATPGILSPDTYFCFDCNKAWTYLKEAGE